ncbi:hypothetical protein KGO5_01731 [Sinorhizobium sp. KGO-5]|uniref:hypothetical protein n=1 Tax=Sinorhizobium sp. KGO-5 TaxID=1470810 RepID=UPI00294903E3|nr:hypothetical protein KGO5_01731 [Sinorhizobium sp. KGO-5]
MTDIFWIAVQEPGKVLARKGPFRTKYMARTLREFMGALPGAILTVVTIDDGEPWFEDVPTALLLLDGRSRPRCRRHWASSRKAFADAGSK